MAEKYLFKNRQWAVTRDGMVSLEQSRYFIPKGGLAELRDEAEGICDWTEQVAEKTWVDIEAFLEAFEKAIQIHNPPGREKINWEASVRSARQEAAANRRR